MEKSIESIWKEGFINQEAIVVPKLNNLYSKKSIHIIDKFKRMFRYNHWYIILLALIHLTIGMVIGAPVAGILMCCLLFVLILISNKSMKVFNEINQGASSYEYLKSFDNALKKIIAVLSRYYQFFYPLYFAFMMVGFTETDFVSKALGKIMNNSDTLMLFNLPVLWLGTAILIVTLAAIFAKPLFRLDLNAIYGRVMNKLDELLTDMEELRHE